MIMNFISAVGYIMSTSELKHAFGMAHVDYICFGAWDSN